MLRTAARRLLAKSFAPALPLRAVPMRFFCQPSQPIQPIQPQPTSESNELSDSNAEEGEEEEVDSGDELWDVPGTVDEFGFFNEQPMYEVEPKMTRTSYAAYQLWELCAEEKLDLRLLAEMFNRLQMTLKRDVTAEIVFSRMRDPEQTDDEDLKRTSTLTAEQMRDATDSRKST